MKIKLIVVGKSMPTWIETGYYEYAKRLPVTLQLELIEIPLNKRYKNADLTRMIADETKQMLSHIQPQDHVIALDVKGKSWNTVELAEQLKVWLSNGHNICLLIGGPEGLSQESLTRAKEKWSLSNLTLPHPIVRVVVAEQLYRAWSIISNHPYHR